MEVGPKTTSRGMFRLEPMADRSARIGLLLLLASSRLVKLLLGRKIDA
jgi:hypothetical protein